MTGDYTIPEPNKEKDPERWESWKDAVDKAVGKTLLTLARNIVLVNQHTDHPVPLLAHLKKLFSGSMISDVLTLSDRYSSTRCLPGGVVTYLAEMNELRSSLAELGDDIADDKHALALAKGLKDGAYDDVRKDLLKTVYIDPERFSYALVERVLLARSREEEADKVDAALAARFQALHVNTNAPSQQRLGNKAQGHGMSGGGLRLGGTGRCFNCCRFGHFKTACQYPASTTIPDGHETKDAYLKSVRARQNKREAAKLVVTEDSDSCDSEYPVVSQVASQPSVRQERS